MKIVFDMPSIISLREEYMATMECLLEQLPDLNWDSRVEIKDYFASEMNIGLRTTQLSELKAILKIYALTVDQMEFVELVIEYLKVKYLVRNYLDCIIRHADEHGEVQLREVNGEWLMPNRQPQPQAKEIVDCIIRKEN